MALFSAQQLRSVDIRAPAPREPADTPPSHDLLHALAAEGARPAYSRVVFVGIVRTIEFSLLLMSGLGLYLFHVAPQIGPRPVYYFLSVAVALLAVLTFQTLQSYTLPTFRRPIRQIFRMCGGWLAIFAVLLATVFFAKLEYEISRLWLAGWFFLGLLLLTIERFALARVVGMLGRSGRLERRVVVVGGGDLARELLRDLAKADPAEVRLLGVFDDRGDARSPGTVEGFAKLGTVDDLVEFARLTRIDLAIFALPISAEQRILEMLRKLWVLPIDVRLAAHANRLRLRPRSYSYVGSAPMLDVFDKPLADWDVVIKLMFDKVVGTLALIALSPILLATAIAIKLDSKGPILFKQKRYGFNNELVEVFKFRSMYADKLDPTASKLVTRDDPRVTRVGRFIRKTSIDELPQLFNVVFKGDLSLVGPRPHAIHAKAENRQYDEVVDGYFARHRVKPGITGWAQVHGWRGETDTQEKIQQRVDHDLHYIENWSLWLDLYILAITPASLIKTTNAF
jgi:Undecaprenyl-phosphate glucose phosphotransferase